MSGNGRIVGALLVAFVFLAAGPLLASQECAYLTVADTMVTIDSTDNSIATRVPFGRYTAGSIALTPDGSVAFVGTADGLAVLDTETNRVVATIPLGIYSAGPISFSPDGATAYATGTYEFGAPARAAVLFVIDVGTRQVVHTIEQAENAAVSPDGRTVYAVRTDVWLQSAEPPRLLFIDARTGDVTGILPNVPYARKIVVTPDSRSAYLGSTGYPDSRIVRIDAVTRALAGTIDLAGELTDLSLSSDGTMAYATTYNTDIGNFVLFDLPSGTEVGKLAFEGVPDAFALTRDQRRAYILLRPDIRRQEPAVGVIDVPARTVAAMIPLRAWGTAIDIATVPHGCSAPVCEGDCDSNGQVTVDEILAGAAMSLGEVGELCAAYAGDSGTVSVDALVRAVAHALNGCP